MGSLQRRLRGCMVGVRAEPFAYGAPELIDLERHLAKRAAGMKIDAPAVRPQSKRSNHRASLAFKVWTFARSTVIGQYDQVGQLIVGIPFALRF